MTPEQKPTMEDVLQKFVTETFAKNNSLISEDFVENNKDKKGLTTASLAAMKEWEQISMKERDLVIQGLEEGSQQWKDEYDRCRYLLQLLVDLKKEKDEFGKTDNYLKMQPLAWEEAKTFLSKYQHY